MAITVRCFGTVREAVGKGEISLDPAGLHTLSDVVARVAQDVHTSHLATWLGTGHLRLARNRTHAPADTPVVDGDEVALFPPVSGG